MASFWLHILLIPALGALSALAAEELDWWQKAVIYQIYPRSFKDGDGDGVGDLKGITSKLEHLADAGVAAAWLSPIYKSPMRDFGYDIADFYNVDPIFGTMDDFAALKNRAQELGLRVIMDFVPNHSSNDSEWFQKSIKRIDPYTDYYVWEDGIPNEDSDRPGLPNNWISNFGGPAWEWNEERQQYYLHQFGVFQPDLNYRSPLVVEEMKNVIRHWLDLGVDGFRMDAVPYLFEDASLTDEPRSGDPTALPTEEKYVKHIYTQNLPETYDMVQQWRALLDEYSAKDGRTRMMMTECYATLEQTMAYYGTEERPGAHFPFNFQFISYINNASTAEDVRDVVLEWQNNKPSFGWSNWVIGNHDNHRVASRFGAPLVDGMNALAQLLPGTALTYNGEEIGMQDGRITWEETVDPMAVNAGPERFMLFSRDPERTPYEWDASENAGFTTGSSTWLPVNSDYKSVNLAAEQADSRSHYRVYQRIVKARALPAVQQGDLDIRAINNDVVAFSRTLSGEATVLVAVNLGSNSYSADLTALDGSLDSEQFAVLVASGNASLKEGDLVSTDSVQLGPKDALVLIST